MVLGGWAVSYERGTPVGALCFKCSQDSPTTRPSAERTAEEAFWRSGRVPLSSARVEGIKGGSVRRLCNPTPPSRAPTLRSNLRPEAGPSPRPDIPRRAAHRPAQQVRWYFVLNPHRWRWSSNPSGKCSYERPTRGTVCGTMRSMCGADAGCLAINYQSLKPTSSLPALQVPILNYAISYG